MPLNPIAEQEQMDGAVQAWANEFSIDLAEHPGKWWLEQGWRLASKHLAEEAEVDANVMNRLFEALARTVLKNADDWQECIEQAEAALAKARGEKGGGE